jgi:copper homeostasis protein (lipoprotein)
MDQERQFLQTLGKVERYRIERSRLDMLDAAGAVIARFEPGALR